VLADNNSKQEIKVAANNLNSEPNNFATKNQDPSIAASNNCSNSPQDSSHHIQPKQASNRRLYRRLLYPDPVDIENFAKEIPIILQIGPNFAQAIQELNTLDWVSRCLFPPRESPTTRKDIEGKWYVPSYYHAKYLYTDESDDFSPALYDFHPSIDCIICNGTSYRI